MEESNSNDKIQEQQYPVVEIDKRLLNIEKAIESFESVAVEAIEKWSENKKQQVELEREKDVLNDSQHKRVTTLIMILIAVVFILTLISLLYKEYELVKWIMTSSFAVGAGAGITSLIKKK